MTKELEEAIKGVLSALVLENMYRPSFTFGHIKILQTAYEKYKESVPDEKQVAQKIVEYIEERSQKAWDNMGSTSADDYTETCTKEEYFNFGQFRAFEDIQRFIEKLNNN
jgi:hypothetical protein